MTIHHLSLDGFIGGSIAIIGIVLALVINPLIGNKYIFTEHIHYGFWSSNGKTKIIRKYDYTSYFQLLFVVLGIIGIMLLRVLYMNTYFEQLLIISKNTIIDFLHSTFNKKHFFYFAFPYINKDLTLFLHTLPKTAKFIYFAIIVITFLTYWHFYFYPSIRFAMLLAIITSLSYWHFYIFVVIDSALSRTTTITRIIIANSTILFIINLFNNQVTLFLFEVLYADNKNYSKSFFIISLLYFFCFISHYLLCKKCLYQIPEDSKK